MDAVEFVRVIKRMLNAAPIKGGNHVITSFVTPEEEVARIEQWAKEHPIKTRQSVFLEQWPNAEFDCQGVIVIDPCDVDKTMHGKDEDCYNCNCDDCRREFWMQEVE